MNDKHSGVRRGGQRRREQEELRLPSKMVKTPVIWSSRPVRDLRECCGGDQSSPQLQRCRSTRSVVMTRTGAGVERASQAEDAQMPTWERPAAEKGVPIIGVDYGYLWRPSTRGVRCATG